MLVFTQLSSMKTRRFGQFVLMLSPLAAATRDIGPVLLAGVQTFFKAEPSIGVSAAAATGLDLS
jgi:hypothetical protein